MTSMITKDLTNIKAQRFVQKTPLTAKSLMACGRAAARKSKIVKTVFSCSSAKLDKKSNKVPRLLQVAKVSTVVIHIHIRLQGISSWCPSAA